MTTLLVLVVVAALIGGISYITNSGLGDRRGHALGDKPSTRDVEALLVPLASDTTRIVEARDGHAVKLVGRVESVAQPLGAEPIARRWALRVAPGDAGGTRARFIISDDSGRALVEIARGTIETFVSCPGGWEPQVLPPAIVAGDVVRVFGVGRWKPDPAAGYRDGARLLVVAAAFVASGELP
jgi:hypothetical protein